MPKPQYNLPLDKAIEVLEAQVEKHRNEGETPQVKDMTPDDAWVVGYATLLHDLKSLTGPDPREIGITMVIPRKPADD